MADSVYVLGRVAVSDKDNDIEEVSGCVCDGSGEAVLVGEGGAVGDPEDVRVGVRVRLDVSVVEGVGVAGLDAVDDTVGDGATDGDCDGEWERVGDAV